MRNYSAIIDRRCICCSIVGLGLNVALAKLPFGFEHGSTDQEFRIVNGWVLTREDTAASHGTPDVV
jgi:hypothetical protein